MKYISGLLSKTIKFKVTEMKNVLLNMTSQIKNLNPETILKRGYSITLKNGKIITDERETRENDYIETIVYKGKLYSQIKK
jgi:exodeoxyribonuclease VII large subunit